MSKKIILALLTLSIFIGISYYNATVINTKQISTKQETLKSNKIDEDIDGLLIAYFSDLYYGSFIDKEYIDNLINTINKYQPDVFIFGGDLIDSSYAQNITQEDIDYLTNCFKSIKASKGKYAVLGEQDIQTFNIVETIYSNSNIQVMRNSNNTISKDKNSFINIVGIDPLISGNPDYASSFLGVDNNYYTIVISHCPDTFDEILNHDFDYMLSGHSLGGQIYLPIISLFTRNEGCKKYYTGKITKNGKTLDITNGVGHIHNNARFLADSEIVLYRLDY